MQRPDTKPEAGRSGKTFVLVSGLPRSGTSLMMQLIEAGGIPVMTDKQRGADVDNPRGYYEWEAIKQIAKRPDLLDDNVNGCAIKCISALLPALPPRHHYKVIFMLRPIAEVIASQRVMLARLGTGGASLDPGHLERGLRAHREEIRAWAATKPYVQWLEISYPELVRDPAPAIMKLVEFLGKEYLLNEQAMAAVIDPTLHRHRT
ncbi:MAG: sulfotransferase [Limisphaerales bacterium]